jgi:hypothetical protein
MLDWGNRNHHETLPDLSNGTLTDWIYGISYGRDRGVKSLDAGSGSWAHNSFPEQQVQATYARKEVSVTNRP